MLYADDTTVYYSDPGVNNIQEVLTEDLSWLSSWINCNGLKINLQKTPFCVCPEGAGRKKQIAYRYM